MAIALSPSLPKTEVSLIKASDPQLLPRRYTAKMGAHCSRCVFAVCVSVCVFTTVCVHLDGINAEHKFRVWDTILGYMSFRIIINPSFKHSF